MGVSLRSLRTFGLRQNYIFTHKMNIIKNITLAVLFITCFHFSANEDKYGTTDEQRTLCKGIKRLQKLQEAEGLRRSIPTVGKTCEICLTVQNLFTQMALLF